MAYVPPPPPDPDVRRAATLPSSVYGPDAFEALRERVLARAWHVLDVGPVREPGTASPVTLAPGSLDEPLILTRDAQGVRRLLSNVCTHRGNVLLDVPLRGSTIRCGYHGRCFALDGRCVAAPGFEDAERFPSPSDALPAAALGSWGPLSFGALDPATPFAEWIAPARERLGWASLEGATLDSRGSRTYEVAAHWATYVENYLEGFHVGYVHPSLARSLDVDRYRVEPAGSAVVQVGEAASESDAFVLPQGHPDRGRAIGAYYVWLFPTTMLNLYPWGLSVNVVEPISPTRTRIRFVSYVTDDAARTVGPGADLDRVELEDEAIVERVARGVRSRLYDHGRYAPRHEAGVHHFHRLLAMALAAP